MKENIEIMSCCELAGWIQEQIADEINASMDYKHASKRLKELGLPDVAGRETDILDLTSLEEARHAQIVRSLSQQLFGWCDCPRKKTRDHFISGAASPD